MSNKKISFSKLNDPGSWEISEPMFECATPEDARKAEKIIREWHGVICDLWERLSKFEWQPIETCPNGCIIFCYKNNAGTEIVAFGHNMNGYFSIGDYYTIRVSPTHWMPIPELPEDL